MVECQGFAGAGMARGAWVVFMMEWHDTVLLLFVKKIKLALLILLRKCRAKERGLKVNKLINQFERKEIYLPTDLNHIMNNSDKISRTRLLILFNGKFQ